MLHKNVCVNALCISCSKQSFCLLFIFRALFILLYTALKAQNACFFVLKCFTSQSTISFMSARCHRFLDITSTFRGVNASLLKDTLRRGWVSNPDLSFWSLRLYPKATALPRIHVNLWHERSFEERRDYESALIIIKYM